MAFSPCYACNSGAGTNLSFFMFYLFLVSVLLLLALVTGIVFPMLFIYLSKQFGCQHSSKYIFVPLKKKEVKRVNDDSIFI